MGEGQPAGGAGAGPAERDGLAARVRRETRAEHAAAESTGFVSALLAGRLPLAGYAALAAQQFFIYQALEAAAEAMRDDPVAGPFVVDELARLPALRADLAYLIGPDWADRVGMSAATGAYRDRLYAVAFSWPAGFVAHHYTRYLGDLAGGQLIRRVLSRRYGLTDAGLRFYLFDGVSVVPFRRRYRQLLDAAPWDSAEQDRFVAEVARAFRHNTEVFDSLGREFAVGVR